MDSHRVLLSQERRHLSLHLDNETDNVAFSHSGCLSSFAEGVVTARFSRPAAPAADAACPEAASAPSVPAVSSDVLETPVPADRPARRPASRLEDMGDVLTDGDLAALLQVSPRFAEKRRYEARKVHRAPDLPKTIDGCTRPRYWRVDVEHWLRTGRSAAPVVAHRRSA